MINVKWLYILSMLFGGTIEAVARTGFIAGHPSLAYWRVGNRHEIVIALHGGPGMRHTYLRPEFDGLTRAATIIYYDQRDIEEADTYIWQEQVNDLRRVIKTFAKTRKVFLAGSSWGSILAMLYAYTYPNDVKGLILSGTVAWEGQNLDSAQYQAYKAKRYPKRRPMVFLKGKLTENRLVTNHDQDSTWQGIMPIEKTLDHTLGHRVQSQE